MKRFICGMCNTHVYNYKFDDSISGKHVNADDFEPIKNFPQPQDGEPMMCPNCLVFWNPRLINEDNEKIIVYGLCE